MKKICFITTSRADFGALNELIKEAVKKNFLLVQLIVSGNHFSKVFGKTEKEINKKKKDDDTQFRALSFFQEPQLPGSQMFNILKIVRRAGEYIFFSFWWYILLFLGFTSWVKVFTRLWFEVLDDAGNNSALF